MDAHNPAAECAAGYGCATPGDEARERIADADAAWMAASWRWAQHVAADWRRLMRTAEEQGWPCPVEGFDWRDLHPADVPEPRP